MSKSAPKGCLCNPKDWLVEITPICDSFKKDWTGVCKNCEHNEKCHKKEELEMYLCATDHEEVCFEGSDCPFCEKIKEFESMIEKLEDAKSDLESEVADLEDDLMDAKKEVKSKQ